MAQLPRRVSRIRFTDSLGNRLILNVAKNGTRFFNDVLFVRRNFPQNGSVDRRFAPVSPFFFFFPFESRTFLIQNVFRTTIFSERENLSPANARIVHPVVYRGKTIKVEFAFLYARTS